MISVLGRPPVLKSFAVYYGIDKVDQLKKFDLVIVSPLLNNKTIKELRKENVLVVGYVSISTIGNWEPWKEFVEEDMIIEKTELWKEVIVNTNDKRWQNIIINRVVPYLLSKGFDGVFFDNLDIVDIYPEFKKGIVRIIQEVREKYKNLFIVVNRGFSIVDDIAPYIDAILFECFATYYNFTAKRYEKWSGSDLEWILAISKRLKNLSEKYGFLVLALGYANLKDKRQLEEFMSYVNSLAKQFGFIPYITDIYLKEINLNYAKRSFKAKAEENIQEYYQLQCLILIILLILFLALAALTLRKRFKSLQT